MEWTQAQTSLEWESCAYRPACVKHDEHDEHHEECHKQYDNADSNVALCISESTALSRGLCWFYTHLLITVTQMGKAWKFVTGYIWTNVRWVYCHQGMARPRVLDGRKASEYGG
jgi:hypothetical protein